MGLFNLTDFVATESLLNDYLQHSRRVGFSSPDSSFGCGVYCLTKGDKQVLTNYKYVPRNLTGAIVEANPIRKDFAAGDMLPDNVDQLRCPLREFHPERHETCENQGRARGGLRAHTGRAGVLRPRGDPRLGDL